MPNCYNYTETKQKKRSDSFRKQLRGIYITVNCNLCNEYITKRQKKKTDKRENIINLNKEFFSFNHKVFPISHFSLNMFLSF